MHRSSNTNIKLLREYLKMIFVVFDLCSYCRDSHLKWHTGVVRLELVQLSFIEIRQFVEVCNSRTYQLIKQSREKQNATSNH